MSSLNCDEEIARLTERCAELQAKVDAGKVENERLTGQCDALLAAREVGMSRIAELQAQVGAGEEAYGRLSDAFVEAESRLRQLEAAPPVSEELRRLPDEIDRLRSISEEYEGSVKIIVTAELANDLSIALRARLAQTGGRDGR